MFRVLPYCVVRLRDMGHGCPCMKQLGRAGLPMLSLARPRSAAWCSLETKQCSHLNTSVPHCRHVAVRAMGEDEAADVRVIEAVRAVSTFLTIGHSDISPVSCFIRYRTRASRCLRQLVEETCDQEPSSLSLMEEPSPASAPCVAQLILMVMCIISL